jgi:membrane-associated phospholipid phosphatase
VGLFILFALRQICQGLCALPPPETMIWHHPGFPSLLVTYGVSNDLFFSGHTAIAVLGAVELGRLGKRWLGVLGAVVAILEAATVLILRAHYTMDVFAGAVAALCVAAVAAKLAPGCDRALERLGRCLES